MILPTEEPRAYEVTVDRVFEGNKVVNIRCSTGQWRGVFHVLNDYGRLMDLICTPRAWLVQGPTEGASTPLACILLDTYPRTLWAFQSQAAFTSWLQRMGIAPENVRSLRVRRLPGARASRDESLCGGSRWAEVLPEAHEGPERKDDA